MFISLPPRSDMCWTCVETPSSLSFTSSLYDVIPAGSVTRYCGSFKFEFSLFFSKAIFQSFLLQLRWLSRMTRNGSRDPTPKTLIFSGIFFLLFIIISLTSLKTIFFLFSLLIFRMLVCKKAGKKSTQKSAWRREKKRSKKFEWMDIEGDAFSRCIITKEANNDDNRFRGGILRRKEWSKWGRGW